MTEDQSKALFIPVDLKKRPLSVDELKQRKKQLKSTLRFQHNLIIGIFVLGVAVSYQTIFLGYDTGDLELFKLSLYVGLWLGLFTGLMTSGTAMRRFKMTFISLIVSASGSLFTAMMTTLLIGGLADWIASMSILGGAMGCMWVLTHYDVALKGYESIALVNAQQFSFIKKVGRRFDEINRFNHQIANQDRIPTVGEFWAIKDWFRSQSST